MTKTDVHLQSIRRLTQMLAVSGAFNIVLLALFFYLWIREVPPQPYCQHKPAIPNKQQSLVLSSQGSEAIHNLMALPFDQLIGKLNSTVSVENGYLERDLALGCLVTFYHFDLDRALGQLPLTQRCMLIFGTYADGRKAHITALPNLTDNHFQTIVHYAKTERWPITSQGLFHLLQNQKDKIDPTLMEAFVITPEFMEIETIFNRSEAPFSKAELLAVLLDGPWEMILEFVEAQRHSQDLSPGRRQRFLMDYVAHKSNAAAHLLLKTDREFALNQEALAAHIPKKEPAAPTVVVAKEAPKTDVYVVQEGDSLWKISRRFKVNLFVLKQFNHLDTDFLKPGMALKIP